MRLGLEDVVVRRRGHVGLAVPRVDFHPGTLTAIVGGDGAGKTTLLRVLVGAVAPTAGRVQAPPRDRIGYVSAGSGVYPDLTVDENLRWAAAAYRVRGITQTERIDRLVHATGLRAARYRLSHRLSGGMRQKLAFACAMVHQPELLVMDEPTTGVDPVSRSELWRLVSTAIAAGTTAVFATTYVDEAARADHVLVLDQGRQLVAGSPDQIRTAVPGRVVRLTAPVDGLPSWRRGRLRHAWVAHGAPPKGTTPLEADLEDAVIVAALAANSPPGMPG